MRQSGALQEQEETALGVRAWEPSDHRLCSVRQALRPSSALLAKYTGWVTALGRHAGEKRGKADRWGPGTKDVCST